MSKKKDYEVGYGKPPKATQFKPGQSGNPKGRRKGAQSMPDIVESVTKEIVTVRTEKGAKRMTKNKAYVLQVYNKALAGDVRCMRLWNDLVRESGHKKALSEAVNETHFAKMREDDKAILSAFLPPAASSSNNDAVDEEN